MLLARTRCALGRHQPSVAGARRHDDGWIGRCRHCRAPMAYLKETGWFRASGPNRPHRAASRWLIQIASVAVALAPIQSSAAQNEGPFGTADQERAEPRVSLAEQEIRHIRQSGMHCRSRIDGSNDDAVRQAKAAAAHPGSYVHLDTEVWPEKGGRHAFAMAYTIEDGTGHRALRRAFGWLDNTDCSARITHG